MRAARQALPLPDDSGDDGEPNQALADQAVLPADPALPEDPAPAVPDPEDPVPVQAGGLQVSFQQILVIDYLRLTC